MVVHSDPTSHEALQEHPPSIRCNHRKASLHISTISLVSNFFGREVGYNDIHISTEHALFQALAKVL